MTQLLQLEGGTRCARAREIGAGKLADVRLRLADLQRMEAVLSRLVDRCGSTRGPGRFGARSSRPCRRCVECSRMRSPRIARDRPCNRTRPAPLKVRWRST